MNVRLKQDGTPDLRQFNTGYGRKAKPAKNHPWRSGLGTLQSLENAIKSGYIER